MFKKISIRHLLATVAVLLTASVAKAQSWDFTTTSTADVALLSADTENWTYTESSSRYSLNNTISSAALTANDTELTMTSGLLFTTTGSDKLRIDVDKRLILNGSTTLLTIPDLTAGQTVTIVFASSSSETARTITPSNLSSTSGFSAATSSTTQTGTGTVTADGSVTFTPSGGMYIYSLTVTDASGTEGSGSTSEDDTNYSSGVSSGITGTISSDNSDGLSTTANQALITSSDGKVRYYNTANLSSIDFDDANNKVTVKGSSFSDEYVSLATNVAFSKAADQGTSGTATGNINVTESKGWYESAYAKWTPVSGASSYSVKIKGGQYSDYTAIDAELIRTYSSYVRADVVGLQAGTDYSLLITALDSDGTTELATATVTGLEVSNYSREGFAHKASEISGFDVSGGIGAYKNDGTLKSGAKVLYVTPETAATISTEVKTGSSSTETFTGFQDIIYGYQKGYDTTPITFRIIGCIQADDVDSFGSSSEGIQIKGKNGYDEMNITIEGIGEDATIHGFGFLIRNAGSIEFRNLAIMWQMDDGLSLDTKNSNVWMHNLDMYYGQVGSDGDQAKGDGTIDIKGNSK